MYKRMMLFVALGLGMLVMPAVAAAHTLKTSTATAHAGALAAALREDPDVVAAAFKRCWRVSSHKIDCALWLNHVDEGRCAFHISVHFKSGRSHRVTLHQHDRSIRCQ